MSTDYPLEGEMAECNRIKSVPMSIRSYDKINGKIQRAEQMKVHTMFVIGKRDMDGDAVSVRVHGKGNLGARPRSKAIAELLRSIQERRG